MCLIKEIARCDFSMEEFKFIIGEYNTYNRYYKIQLNYNNKEINIGMQGIYIGISPQVQLMNDYILIGVGESFYVYDLIGNKVKEILIGSAFYVFFIQNDNVLIVGELDLFLLNNLFNTVWERHFDEIIDIKNINEEIIEIVDYNKNYINLDFLTGKEICKFKDAL